MWQGDPLQKLKKTGSALKQSLQSVIIPIHDDDDDDNTIHIYCLTTWNNVLNPYIWPNLINAFAILPTPRAKRHARLSGLAATRRYCAGPAVAHSQCGSGR